VTASAISPGFIDNEMSSWTKDSIPTDAMIKVEDIVRLRRPDSTSATSAVLPHIINLAGGRPYHA
jgi:3-oxoacyl-[acyl-carrier protein] reductase